jgi:hypothetical protein
LEAVLSSVFENLLGLTVVVVVVAAKEALEQARKLLLV